MASGTVSKESERAPVVRVRSEPAFVLSSQPWKETSVIAELLTRHHGRVTVVARGAKRISSRFRGIIMPFVPLVVSFSGAGEIKNLTDARWMGSMTPNEHEGLVSAFYVNELILRMTVRGDSSVCLYNDYLQVLSDLTLREGRELSVALRSFEIKLLNSLGWSQASKVEEIDKGGIWTVRQGELVCVDELYEGERAVTRDTALAVAAAKITPCADLREVRDVLRRIIGYYVGDKGLKTRKTLEIWSQI